MSEKESNKPQVLGGKARAQLLSPEARRAIAQDAAEARWNKVAGDAGNVRLPRATHNGELKIGNVSIPCAVLEDGTRVITQRGMFVALGMNKNPSKGQTAIENRPGFVSANNLTPYISEELARSWTPIPFRLPKGSGGYRGNIAFGYDAKILPMVCHAYLDAKEAGKLTNHQRHIGVAAKIIERGFSVVGIVALVDEATGYQEVRDRQALQEILRQYISGALFEWTKTFPMEFYKEIFRLKGWTWNAGKMPGVVGKYTRDLVYSRLAPGVIEELERLNPPTDTGYRKYRHHQYLTREIGHPVLSRRLYELIGMARASETWEKFCRVVDRAFPKLNTTLSLPLEYND
ncbi:MAG: P63C domain-containing protein [Candidatus Acidiferrales bacterium]